MIVTDPYMLEFTGPFTPLQLPALKGWYDASDLASITESGGLVSQWDDKSGNGNHAVQATGANKFTLTPSFQNGLPAMRANGLGNMPLLGGALLSNGANYAFVVGGNKDGTSGTLFLNTSSSGIYLMHLTPSGVMDSDISGTRAVSGLGSATTDDSVHLMSHVVNGSGWTVSFDAAQNSGPSTGGLTVTGICAYTTSALWLDGTVCEVIFGAAALSSGLIAACNNYLKTKWGTP